MTRIRVAGIVFAVTVGLCTAGAGVARSQGCVSPPAGLVSWFPGDGNALDVTGGHDGVLAGGAGYAPGRVQQAFALDGVDGVVSAPDNDAWTLAGDFTLMAWVNLASIAPSNPFVSHMETSAPRHGWAFGLFSGTLELHLESPETGVVQPVSASWAPAVGAWHHVAVTRSGSSWALFVDGTPAGGGNHGTAIPDAVAPLCIGAAEGAGSSGRVDEVQLFSRALSGAEVAAIQAAGSAGLCKAGLDTIAIADAQVCAGGSVDVPVYIRDLSGTPLGMDRPAGSRIQGFGLKVSYAPATWVSAISVARAGVTAGLEPALEQTTRTAGTISYVVVFNEATDPVPFTLDAPLPGDLVATLHLVTSGTAVPGSTVELALDSGVSELSNDTGTAAERAADGTLRLLDAALHVAASPAPATGLAATATAGPAVDLSWVDNAFDETGYEIERREAGVADFSPLATVGAGSVSYHDGTGLLTGKAYFYRVRASGPCPSGWSNVSSVIVPGTGPAFCRTPLTAHKNAQNAYVEYGDGFFGAIWREQDGPTSALVYARLDATGQITGGPLAVTPWAGHTASGQLVWNGSEWGLLFYEWLGDAWALFFTRLDADGHLLGGTTRVNEATRPGIPNNTRTRGLAWHGTGWGVTWLDTAATTPAVYFAGLAPSGTVVVHETLVSDSPASVSDPVLASNGTDFGLVWFDARVSPLQLFFRRLGTDGSPAGPSVQATSAGYPASFAELVWNGIEYGLAWTDSRDGDSGLYLRRLDAGGTGLSAETRISDPVSDTTWSNALDPVLRWLGDRWVAAADGGNETTPNWEIGLVFADASGARTGSAVFVSTPQDSFASDFPALAWGSGTLLALWHDSITPNTREIHAQAMDASGAQGSNPRRVLTTGHTPGMGVIYQANLAFTGSGLAAAWFDARGGGPGGDPMLRLVDGSGAPLTPEIPVADPGPPRAALPAGPAIAFSGEVIGVLWTAIDSTLNLSRFSSAGAKLGPDLLLATVAHSGSGSRSLLWTGEVFLAAWSDKRDGNWEIYTAAIDAAGTVLSPANRISSASGLSWQPALAGDGRARAVVWADWRDGSSQVYAAALDLRGARVGPEVRVTDNAATGSRPDLGWNGSELYSVWADWREGLTRIYGQRLAADATPLGSAAALSPPWAAWPRCAWGAGQWAVVYPLPDAIGFTAVDAAGNPLESRATAAGSGSPSLASDGQRLVLSSNTGVYWDNDIDLISLECALDTTPPACPTGLTATMADGDAQLAWTPGSDEDFALAWQYIARDGVRVAVVEPGVSTFTDRTPPVGNHTYSVTSVNQANLESSNCTAVPAYAPATGDANGDGTLNVLDVFALINHLFAGGADPRGSGDANRDGVVSVADVFYLINHLFAGGPPPR